jgi:hypothetical protein
VLENKLRKSDPIGSCVLESMSCKDFALCSCCGDVMVLTRLQKKRIQVRRKIQLLESEKQEKEALRKKSESRKKKKERRKKAKAFEMKTDDLVKAFSERLMSFRCDKPRITLPSDVQKTMAKMLHST